MVPEEEMVSKIVKIEKTDLSLTKPSKQVKRRKKAKAQKNVASVSAVKDLIRPKSLTLLQKVLS